MTKRIVSKKKAQLIDLLVDIPSSEQIKYEGMRLGGVVDREQFVIDYLIRALEIVTRNTQHENIAQEVILKCIEIYGDEKMKR